MFAGIVSSIDTILFMTNLLHISAYDLVCKYKKLFVRN
jgi:hypothetical protein